MTHLTIQQTFKAAMEHHRDGRLLEAEAFYHQILSVNPKHAGALHFQGVIAHQRGRAEVAVDLIRRALAINPNLPEAHSNLGMALQDLQRNDEAIGSYRAAIALKPDLAEAYCNLGSAYLEKGEVDNAVVACQQAIAIRPGYAKAYTHLGNALRDQADLDGAIAAYRQAIATAQPPQSALVHGNLAYTMLFHSAYDARSVADELARWNHRHAEPLGQLIHPPSTPLAGSGQATSGKNHSNNRDPDRQLRVGYISPDFREHCQALFTQPLLSNHNREEVEVVCYSDVICEDETTRRLQGFAHEWRSIRGQSDEEVAQTIQRDQIDLLVDLTMHMSGTRLLVFARKPAPVQVCWLAYPASTGLTAIDYRLSDPFLDPPGIDESVYSEKTIRLPDTFWCYDPQIGRRLSVSASPALALGSVTFGCLNNFCKINEGTLTRWAKVLGEVPRSRFLLLAPPGTARQRIMKHFGDRGIDPQRIEFTARRPRLEYLELYNRIDIGLDTFPYNGHTTSLDAFWMGVPVITLVGQTPVARAGWCQLSNLGLQELAAHTADDFVRIATNLAEDLPRLSALRSTLRQRIERSPLMDAKKFARNVEAAYRQIWRSWCGTTSLAPG